MNHIKLLLWHNPSQPVVRPQTEGERLRKGAEKYSYILIEVQRGEQPKWLWGKMASPAIGIQAFEFLHLNGINNIRMRRAGEQMDFMSEVAQFLREIVNVNALTTTVRMPSVRQKAYLHEITPTKLVRSSTARMVVQQRKTGHGKHRRLYQRLLSQSRPASEV